MTVNPVFSNSFYEEHPQPSHFGIKDGAICILPEEKKSFSQSILNFFLGKLANPDLCEVAKKISETQSQNYLNAFEDDVHNKGYVAAYKLQTNLYFLNHDIQEASHPSMVVRLMLRVVNIVRSFFSYAPIEVPPCPPSSCLDLGNAVQRGLQLRGSDDSRCTYTSECWNASKSPLLNAQNELKELELGLKSMFPFMLSYKDVASLSIEHDGEVSTLDVSSLLEEPLILQYDNKRNVFTLSIYPNFDCVLSKIADFIRSKCQNGSPSCHLKLRSKEILEGTQEVHLDLSVEIKVRDERGNPCELTVDGPNKVSIDLKTDVEYTIPEGCAAFGKPSKIILHKRA